MKQIKYNLGAALVLLMLTGVGCSNSNIPLAPAQTNTSVDKVLVNQYTENTDMTEQEIKQIQKFMVDNKAQLEDKNLNFSVKTASQGSDVSIDMLLMNPKATSRAKFWGIKTADQLVNAGSSPFKRAFLNWKLGGLFPSQAFKSQILFWVERADLLRIKDVSLDDSFLLSISGITSAPHLATFNNIIDQNALKVQLSLLAFEYGMQIPTLEQIQTWTQEAMMVEPILY